MDTPQDMIWVLSCATLVLLMQAGFCCLETGLVRAKNSINVATKNIVDFFVSALCFWCVGFALMFGPSLGGLVGSSGFLFSQNTPSELSFFVFQIMFCGTAVTIIGGAVAERTRFIAYVFIAVLVSTVIYPLVGHWIWGGGLQRETAGWLAELGFVDFAGSTVVHSVGGWVALAAVLVVGPRIGRFGPSSQRIQGHNMPLVTLGAIILWFGWLGFNGGSTLAVTTAIPSIFANTILAGVAGGIIAILVSWKAAGKPDVSMTINGCLAGLVGVTASCNAVMPYEAACIGCVGAVVCIITERLLEKLKVDDVIGAVSVHASAGAWGTLAVALFADLDVLGSGLSRSQQFLVQLFGVVVCFAWSFGLSYVVFFLVNRFWFELRVSKKDEHSGLNIAEHDATTALVDLLTDMEGHRCENDFSKHVTVEPNTEVGQIATQYNRVLDRVSEEASKTQAALQTLQKKNQMLELLNAVSVEADEAGSVQEALEIVVSAVCRHSGWHVGHVYQFDSTNSDLKPTDIWYLSDPEKFRVFREVTEATRFGKGIGLPGRVWDTNKPTWIIDVTRDANFPRAKLASELGVRGAYAFPANVGNRPAFILEFFSAESLEPDQALLEAATTLGKQISHILHRKYTEERLNSIIETALDAVITMNSKGQVVSWNSKAEQIFGYSAQEIIGQSLSSTIVPHAHRQAHQEGLARYLQTRESSVMNQRIEITALHKDGHEFPIELAITAIESVGETRFSAFVRDISDRVEANKQLVDAKERAQEANIAKSEFLANMSHEIRTPMTAILGFSDLLEDPQLGRKDREGVIQTIKRNGHYLIDLINDILDLSKIEAGRMEVECIECDVRAVLDEVITLLMPRASERGNEIKMRCQDSVPSVVSTDPTRLRQAVLNLVGNAIKFTENGVVTVEVGIVNVHDTSQLKVDVIDTGIGISSDSIAKIFSPFEQADNSTTRRFGGTGLGLAITKRIAEALGGTLAVHSEQGKGSCFSLTIALHQVEDATHVHAPTRTTPHQAASTRRIESSLDCRVLLVEDGEDNVRLISYILKKAGAAVDIARDGKQGSDAALAALAQGEPYDIVLMDMQMPVMDGYEATRRLRDEGYGGPIVALTAHAMRGDREKCVTAGCDEFATKPIDKAELIRLIAGLADQGRSYASLTPKQANQLVDHMSDVIQVIEKAFANQELSALEDAIGKLRQADAVSEPILAQVESIEQLVQSKAAMSHMDQEINTLIELCKRTVQSSSG